MSVDTDQHAICRRKALKVAVAALASEGGCGWADDMVLETLTEALQAYLSEIGRCARAYAELAGRTESMVSDVILTLVDMGADLRGIPAHAKRENKTVLVPPLLSSQPATQKTLQVGERRPHPPHVPDHLPPFPDPHTYIKTDAIRQPFSEYQLMREKVATQKLSVERALTRYIARTGMTQSLFKDDFRIYPLIAVKPCPLPYLDALLSKHPKDQDLDSQDQETHSASVAIQRSSGLDEIGDSQIDEQDSAETDAIDNPYLRPVLMPKRKRYS